MQTIEGLRVRIDAEILPLLREMRKAGEITKAEARKIEQALAGATRGTALATRGFTNMRTGIQQAGFQIGDFAVQIASGQGALRALTQQGTQLLGAFGPIGAVLGAAGAIAGAVATSLFEVGDSSKEAEKRAKELSDRMDRLSETMDELRGVAEPTAEALAAAGRNIASQFTSELAVAEQKSKDLLKAAQDLRDAGLDAGVFGLPGAEELTGGEGKDARKAEAEARARALAARALTGEFGDRFSVNAKNAAAALELIEKQNEKAAKAAERLAEQQQRVLERSAQARERIIDQIARLEEQAALEGLEGVAKVSAERENEIARFRQLLNDGTIAAGDFERARVAIASRAAKEITGIRIAEMREQVAAITKLREKEQRAAEQAVAKLDRALAKTRVEAGRTRDSGAELASGITAGLREATSATATFEERITGLADRINETLSNILLFGPLEDSLRRSLGKDPLGIGALFGGGRIKEQAGADIDSLPDIFGGASAASDKLAAALDTTTVATTGLGATGDITSNTFGNQVVGAAVQTAVATGTQATVSETATAALAKFTLAVEAATARLQAMGGGGDDGGGLGKALSLFGGGGGPMIGGTGGGTFGAGNTTGAGGAGFSFTGFGGPRASGGPVVPNTAFLVGEQGPELFVPNMPGRVMSHRDSMRAMGGGGVTINVSETFILKGSQTEREAAAAHRQMRAIADERNQDLVNRVNRGGAEAKAFGRR